MASAALMSVGIRGIFGCVPSLVNYGSFALRVRLAAIAEVAQAPRRAAGRLQRQPQAQAQAASLVGSSRFGTKNSRPVCVAPAARSGLRCSTRRAGNQGAVTEPEA